MFVLWHVLHTYVNRWRISPLLSPMVFYRSEDPLLTYPTPPPRFPCVPSLSHPNSSFLSASPRASGRTFYFLLSRAQLFKRRIVSPGKHLVQFSHATLQNCIGVELSGLPIRLRPFCSSVWCVSRDVVVVVRLLRSFRAPFVTLSVILPGCICF